MLQTLTGEFVWDAGVLWSQVPDGHMWLALRMNRPMHTKLVHKATES